ncbi:GntR family transcriptional regulator [Roseomonas gilardii]|uniref:GntR family transcriptional regulator n=1 Tax=Roseomonas gilardii TaxID=257708 RepID=UPI00119EA157|nr:GntR family transcriptional regulator [Roseomonas gilardii]
MTRPTTYGEPATLAQRAYAFIERLIIEGALRPGEIVSEQGLSERLQIGRTPVREALQRLGANQMLRIEPRRGAVVTEAGPDQITMLLEARAPLERLIARSAALNATGAERALIRDEAQRFLDAAQAGDNQAVIAADGHLKELVVQACHNPYIAAAVAPVHALSRRLYFTAALQPDFAVTATHVVVYRAIADGQAERAVAAVAAVMREVERAIRLPALAPAG